MLIIISSCDNNENKNQSQTTKKQEIGLNMKFMDKSVRPQDDFYNFVNGKWMKTTKIPADRSRWGSFDELAKRTNLNTLKVLDEAIKSKKYSNQTDEGKAIAYYRSILDTVTQKKQGIEPIKTYLNNIKNIKNKKDVIDYMIQVEPDLTTVFFGLNVRADMKNSNKNTLYIYSAGLGLPERDYYISQSEDAKKIRQEYLEYIQKMIGFIGLKGQKAKDFANEILSFETQLATAKMTKEESRKPENTYNPVNQKTLSKLLSNFDIDRFLKTYKIDIDEAILSDKNYINYINGFIKTTPIDRIKTFLTWNLLNSSASELSPEMSNAKWEFYGKTLEGAQERKPLKERALATVNWGVGEAVGKIYVAKLFPAEAKTRAKEMITYLQKAYKQRISNLPWMSDETKKKAIEKVEKLRIKIGYPDKWKDYSKLQVKTPEEGGTFFSNTMAIHRFNFNKKIDKLHKPVDKTEWEMSPQIVNAYYNPSYNEIVFPAAILQPPFYDYKADEAVNYGGIGAVIGHEISHGFDDEGAKYNSDGNFENWWNKKDFEAFSKLVKKLANQYSKIEVLPGVFVNGVFTSGENIGDLGGVNSAFTALQLYYKDHNKPDKIQGFTPEQRFFMSWATIWRTKLREAALKKQIKTDPHSPGQIRATQPLRNVDDFYKAFDIKKGDKMYIAPNERVKIW